MQRCNPASQLSGLFLLAVSLFAEAATTGRVLDQTGRPLEQATVQLLSAPENELLAETETNDQGYFEFPNPPKPNMLVRASKSGYVMLDPSETKRAATSTILTLTKGALITGRAFDSSGRPLRLAKVTPYVSRANHRIEPLPKFAASVDDRGAYRIYGLPPGRYIVAVEPQPHPGNATPFLPKFSAETLHLHPGEERSDIDFHVSTGQRQILTGTVSGASAKTGLVVFATSEHSFTPVAMIASDANGGFAFEAPPGSYEIFAVAPLDAYGPSNWVPGPNPMFGRKHFDLIGYPAPDVSVALSPAVAVEAEITFGVEPPDPTCYQSAWFTLEPLEPLAISGGFRSRVLEGGRSRIPGVSPNTRYLVRLDHLKNGCFIAALQRELETTASATNLKFVLTKTSGDLEGTAPPASKIFVAPTYDKSVDAADVQSVVADSDGHFRIGSLGPGQYRAFAITQVASNDYLDPQFWQDHAEQIRLITIHANEAAKLQLQPLRLTEAWK
ncbi:MAG: carboxypeptidase regulatory-like domain-containing protein [Acidobacteriaceae bacterium]|nr:carboxypeptidase regulatory-like domain-containing protein [Acidobacteriaceae bacterium]